MNRSSKALIEKVQRYCTKNGSDQSVEGLLQFLRTQSDCFDRMCFDDGHITGSAWVLSADRQRVLLNHHAKLDKWLQFGGHSDGDPDTLQVALREAREESGLQLQVLSEEVFDIDIHCIPARGDSPSHRHYDVRFVCEVVGSEAFKRSEESLELRWVPLNEVKNFTTEQSMLRLVEKTKAFQL